MTQYRIREKRFSRGDDFWVETADGERAFKVNGTGSRGTFVLESAAGEELYTISGDDSRPGEGMEIARGGRHLGTITREMAGLHHHYSVAVEAGEDFSVTSNATATELSVERAGETIARASNHWLAIAHTFEVEIEPGKDDALILCAIVAVDWMSRE